MLLPVPEIVPPDAVTPEWLQAILGSPPIAEVRAERVGQGQVGRNLRFTITYEGDRGGAPRSLVGKFPSDDPTSRATGIGLGNYMREVMFYQELAPSLPIRTPRCFHAAVDAGTHDFVLLLEDMAPGIQGDQIAGCGPDDAELVLREAVRLHAPRWGDESLTALSWLNLPAPELADIVQGMYLGAWPGFVERVARGLDEDLLALGERFGRCLAEWLRAIEPPFALTHGDYRLDNMLFGEGWVAVVDWQSPGLRPGVADAAYFLGTSLPADERRTHERDLLRVWRDGLAASGVDYPWDACWREYGRHSIGGLVITVVASQIVEVHERGDEMFRAMASRQLTQAADLGAARFFPA